MKKAILFLILIFTGLCNVLEAQTKVGTIDIDFLLMNMPEIQSVQENLREYGTTIDKQLNEKIAAYQAKLDEYNTNLASYTETQTQEKQTEIFALEDDISKYRQNGIQLIRIREDELKRPLYQKIATALEKVAQADGFTQVFNTNEGSNIVFINPDFDISLKVAAELGLEIQD